MSSAATATNIVNLDDYRRNRGEHKTAPPQLRQTGPVTPPVWVYWVPVWVW